MTVTPGQSPLPVVISAFHDGRDTLLQSLQLILQEAVEGTDEEGQHDQFQVTVSDILDVRTGPASNGSAFARKCLSALADIEEWQTRITEHVQAASVVGQAHDQNALILLDIQRVSLHKQHEALGSIVALLFKGNYTIGEDTRKLLDVPRRWQRLDASLFHYLPAFAAAFTQYGSPDHSSSESEARSLNTAVMSQDSQAGSSALHLFYAALKLIWLAAYSGWYKDAPTSEPMPGVNLEQEADDRTKATSAVLNDGALELLLAVGSSMTLEEWQHPARQELVVLLLDENGGLTAEQEFFSKPFRDLFMESLELFAEAWINNMPDSIRRLKNEEDDLRLRQITAMQDGTSSTLQRDGNTRMHLECFLVMISFAFEHRQEAAEGFWADPDSNLFGFLQWASRRQTVPRVSAFSEMLCAISEGPECAKAAHKFLLDETGATTSRTRRTPSMNYFQMFAELELYAYKVHDRPASSQLPQVRKVLATDMNELESPIMLSCYLRLIAHMCRQTDETRDYILTHPTLNFVQTLLILSSGPVPSYLRASIFTTLDALISESLLANAHHMWTILDQWAAGGPSAFAPSLLKPSPSQGPNQLLRQTLNAITVSFDQYDAFVVFLKSLVSPSSDAPVPSTSLSFPNDLGSSYRTPGISPYVDMVCGQLFRKKLKELSEEGQSRCFRFHCLDFIANCLETFNESYVTLCERGVQAGTNTESRSPSTGYALRHPFARVMGWLFSTDVSKTLMSCAHCRIEELVAAAPGTALHSGLIRTLDILNMVLDFQPTYLDIIRPLVKTTGDVDPITTSSLACFEDVVLSHPELILDLQTYAGIDDDQIVQRSLSLLQRLSSSRRLNNPGLTIGNVRTASRRIVDMLGPDSASDTVSSALASRMQVDIRELENGPECAGYIIKDGILAFLNGCLATQPEQANVAHLLLGFAKVGESVMIEPSGPIETGQALFNAIIGLIQEYPDGQMDTFVSWLIHIKTAAFQALRQLLASSLTSELVIVELRSTQLLNSLLSKQSVVSSETLWNGCSIASPGFWWSDSADGLAEFLSYRAFLFEYAGLELRSASRNGLSAVCSHIFSTLTGGSAGSMNRQNTPLTIFDMLDFADLDVSQRLEMPELRYLASIDIETCTTQASEDSTIFYDLNAARELLQLCMCQISTSDQTKQPSDEEQMQAEANLIMAYLEATNRWSLVQAARAQTLHTWTELVAAMLEYCHMDIASKVRFCLHALQLILPKLDSMTLDVSKDAIDLGKLADSLTASLTDSIAPQEPGKKKAARQTAGRQGNMIIDRLFHLYRTCLNGIHVPGAGPGLREVFCSMCSRYLTIIIATPESYQKTRRSAMDCVRTAGNPLIRALSDDAEDGDESCRLAALTLLGLLTTLARLERSPILVELLVKANMVEVLVDPIKYIASDFQQTDSKDRKQLLAVLEARLSLLLQIARTKEGAGCILDAGLLQAIRDSLLFRADPDLGMDIDNTEALHNYYELLASVLRLLTSTFVSRGIQNEQIQYQMRLFLQEYRPNIAGLLKRFNGQNGTVQARSKQVLTKVVNGYVALMTMADFVEVSTYGDQYVHANTGLVRRGQYFGRQV